MQAIKNDIKKRASNLERYNYVNTERLATIELLEELATSIDFVQKQTTAAFKSIEWYNNQFGMKATTKIRFDIWQIKKASLTRLQNRYKLTLELLIKTV